MEIALSLWVLALLYKQTAAENCQQKIKCKEEQNDTTYFSFRICWWWNDIHDDTCKLQLLHTRSLFFQRIEFRRMMLAFKVSDFCTKFTMKRKQAADILIAYTYLYISYMSPKLWISICPLLFQILKKVESLMRLGKIYIIPKKIKACWKKSILLLMMYLLSIGRRGFTNIPCRFLSKLRIMCLTVVLPQKKGSSKRLFSSCQTWMRSLDCPTHVHGVEDVHHDILQVVVEVSG